MGIVQQESWYEIHKMCHESPEEVIRLVTKTKNVMLTILKTLSFKFVF